MNLVRYAGVALLFLATFAATLGTGGYACYLRSPSYRSLCAERLGERLGMECEVGRVVPRSWTARQFENVRVWLPQRRAAAAWVDRARLAYLPGSEEAEAYELTLRGGRCEVSSRTWLRSDVRFVVASGLRPGFAPGGPKRVVFSNFDLRLERDRFGILLAGTSGVVQFDSSIHASVSAVCRELNGYHPVEAVALSADFSPHRNGIQIDELRLSAPAIPLSALALEPLLGVNFSQGDFSGKLTYAEAANRRCVTLEGECRDLLLGELTAGVLGRAWRGTCPRIRVEELAVNNRMPERLRFSGRLQELHLSDVLPMWGLDAVDGRVELDVRRATLTPLGIEELIAVGYCGDVDLERLSTAIGRGKLSGRAQLTIRDLTVVQNHITSLDASLEVEPPSKGNGWIGRDLLQELARAALHIPLPPILPERIEYARLGAQFRITDEVLHVFGTHGEREKVILTLRLPGGIDLPTVREPEFPVPLGFWLDDLRTRGKQWLSQQMEQLQAASHASDDSPAEP